MYNGFELFVYEPGPFGGLGYASLTGLGNFDLSVRIIQSGVIRTDCPKVCAISETLALGSLRFLFVTSCFRSSGDFPKTRCWPVKYKGQKMFPAGELKFTLVEVEIYE